LRVRKKKAEARFFPTNHIPTTPENASSQDHTCELINLLFVEQQSYISRDLN
jgi:hypothetical protein